jgi:hypothetical protein
MSHVAHHSPAAVRSATGNAFKLTLALLLAAGIAVALILLIDGDKTAPITSPAPVTSVARPDEGLAPITKPASSVTSLFVYPKSVSGSSGATASRPEEGLAPIAKAVAPVPETGIVLRSKAWNQHLGLR